MKVVDLMESKAFSRALAGESITDEMKKRFDSKTNTFNGLTHAQLYEYAKIIADKVVNNLKNGHTF